MSKITNNSFEDIIKLKQNSQAKLIFEVYFKNDWLFDKELLKKYEKQFEETKQSTKFNMKICFVKKLHKI